MKKMIHKIMGDKYFCGLDIGSHSVKAALLTLNDQHRPYVQGIFETPTVGFKQASVTDLNELSECVHQAVLGLSKKTGIKLKEVCLGLSGNLLSHRLAGAVIPLLDRGNKIITGKDVAKVVAQSRLLGVSMEEYVVHEFPQLYKVDDVHIAVNPVGLYGRKLEANILLFVIKNTLLKNLTKAVNQAGLDVVQIFFATYASSQLCLKQQQRKDGCLFVNVGAQGTDMLFFKDDQLRNFHHLKTGGDLITRRIAQRLHLPFGLAEDIKRAYAAALLSDDLKGEEILIKKEEGYFPVKKEEIFDAIEPAVGGWVKDTVKTIHDSRMGHQLNRGVVMSGGGTLLTGLPERVERLLNLPVEVAQVNFSDRRLNGAVRFAAPVALAAMGMDSFNPSESFNRNTDSWLGKTARRVKELYQEYF